MSQAEMEAIGYGWGITLAQLLTPPVDPHDAPIDDEPLTPEDEAAIDEALADKSPLLSSEEVRRRLGL
jgi:hypothetical protein